MTDVRAFLDRTALLQELFGSRIAAVLLLLHYLDEVEVASLSELKALCGKKVYDIMSALTKLGLVKLHSRDLVTLTGTGKCVLKLLQELYRVLAKSALMCN